MRVVGWTRASSPPPPLLLLLLLQHASVVVLLTSPRGSSAIAAAARQPPPDAGLSLGFDAEPIGPLRRDRRRLQVFSFKLSLAQQLGNAIINGDIDEAASILVGAVRGGDSGSVVRGLSLSDDRPGIAQTIVRALGMGLDSEDLEDAVETGGYDDAEAAEVVREVLVLIDGNLVPGTQTADGQVIIPQSSPPVVAPLPPPPPVAAPLPQPPPIVAPLPPPPPIFPSSGQSFGVAGTPTQTTYPPLDPSGSFPVQPPSPEPDLPLFQPTPSPPPPPPPSTTTRAFVDGVEVRQCRGQKEEQCCSEFNYALHGCLCDFSGNCRFEFINAQPPIIRDNHRPDLRSCMCP